MNQPDSQRANRREMLRSAARYLALGGISVVSAGMIWRSRIAADGAQCRRQSGCRECKLLGRCDLPQAIKAKDSNCK